MNPQETESKDEKYLLFYFGYQFILKSNSCSFCGMTFIFLGFFYFDFDNTVHWNNQELKNDFSPFSAEVFSLELKGKIKILWWPQYVPIFCFFYSNILKGLNISLK